MRKKLFDCLCTGLMLASAPFIVAGIVIFWRATSFQGYIGALLMLALAAASFLGALEIKPDVMNTIKGLANHFGRTNAASKNEPQPLDR